MLKQSVVCTLFEGHYHYGVAALVNSLYQQGFRGDVYAGYRGELPYWATFPQSPAVLAWPGGKSFEVTEGLRLHFLPLQTEYHLTNFKPDFMLLLWNSVAKGADQMFYFDPDIVVISPWWFFQKWVECGVGVCEDVNSPLAEFHPRRVAWREYFSDKGVQLSFNAPIYVNGGFIGVEKQDFLLLWKKIQELMAIQIGGLSRSALEGAPLLEENQGPFAPFGRTDQDALNAAIEAWDGKVSFIGQEGMAFKAGSVLMPHALGQPKPWHRKPLLDAINGVPPRRVDRAYWHFANGIITSQPSYRIRLRKITSICAAFIGRFYKKGEL